MTQDPILNRIADLQAAIKYTLEFKKILDDGQRICCHQEIAAWHRVLDPEMEDTEPFYQVPAKISDKIQAIKQINQ